MSASKAEFVIFDQKTREDRDYWIRQLSNPPCEPYLPLDGLRLSGVSREESVLSLQVDGEIYSRLIELTGDGSFLLFTTLLTALKICLYKYSGNPRVVVGSPARHINEQTTFTNAIAISDEIDEGASFREMLYKVRQTLLDAYGRQQYPYARLV